MTKKYPPYLQKRRQRWYAVLEIPKALRSKFGGKARFVQSLETDSLSEAEGRKWAVIGGWKAELEEARTGKRRRKLEPVDLALKLAEGRERDDAVTAEVRADWISDAALELAYADPNEAVIFSKVAHGDSIPTARHIDDWLANSTNEAKTIAMKRSDAHRFARRFEYTHQVDQRAVRAWVHDLQQGERGLSASTLNRVISACRGYWDYLNRAGRISRDDDPFKGAVQKTSKRSKASYAEQRLAFEPSDLTCLLQGATDKGDTVLHDLILVALWTGCRIEEIGSLRLTEVGDDRFEIVDAKSRAGDRFVPIHTRLQPTIRRLRQSSSDGYLLSGLGPNKYGDRTNAVGKRFGRLKTGLGYSKRHVFHSIRKTVATELENLGVPESVAADILGHDKPTMTYGTYSGGTSFALMQEAIEKLSYEGALVSGVD